MKNPLATAYRAVRDTLTGDRVKAQKKHVEEAAWKAARLHSDLGFHATMDQFYREAMDDIDPYSTPDNAWAFAAAKQQQHDNLQDRQLVQVQQAKAGARLAAEVKKLSDLRERHEAAK